MHSTPGISRPSKWFLGSDTDHQSPVPGSYEILGDGQPEIRLYGSWDEFRPPAFQPGDEEHILLHGNVYGQATTAVKNVLRSGSFSMNSLIDHQVHPDYTLEGLFLSEDELAFTSVRFRLWDQDSWTGWRSLTINRDPNDRMSSITIVPPSTLVAEHKGVTIRLCDAYASQATYSDVAVQSHSRFEFEFPEPIPMERLLTDWVKPLETLIITATGRLSGLVEASLTNKFWQIETENESPPSRWVNMRTRHAARPADDQKRTMTIHSLRDLDFGLQLPRIFDAVPKLQFALDQYESLVSHRAGGDLVRCTTAAQMVESLDRVLHPNEVKADNLVTAAAVDNALKDAQVGDSKLRRNIRKFVQELGNPTLEQRLRRLDTELGNLVTDLINKPLWPRHVARVRNVVAHGLEESVVLTTDIGATRVATLICMILFEAHWLRALGFSDDTIRTKIGLNGLRIAFIQGQYASMENLADLRTAATIDDGTA